MGEGRGTVVVLGDTLLDGEIIRAVDHIPSETVLKTRVAEVYDAKEAWVTPGLSRFSRRTSTPTG